MELAKAYVQIIPSSEGIKGSISDVLNDESTSAGQKSGISIASKIKGAIAAAGIGQALSSAISQGAKLEQSLGGIETLFKGDADKVKNYAREAFKTAGVDANSYMEQVTSFSASLLQSLKGDTRKAADSANQAIIDMADNSNKMGTSLDLIQNAYQGFAKQNYTMLDNLKLGYGGTKEEMQRLLKDAQKISGVKYNINNLNDVYSAIHVIQKDLDITGTTSKEAASTLSGSLASMKASFTDLLGNMTLGENIVPSLKNLVTTTGTFLFGNLLPMVSNIVTQIPTIITTLGPQLLTKGISLISSLSSGFISGFPNLLSSFLTFTQEFGNYLTEQAPTFISKGFEILSNIVQGIINALPVLITQLPQVITTFANIINDNAPVILTKGVELIKKLISGIISAIPLLISNIPQIITAIVSAIQAFNWLNLGKSIIDFFGKGIASMVGFIKNNSGNILKAIINTLKSLPSKLLSLASNAFASFSNGIKKSGGIINLAINKIKDLIVLGFKTLPKSLLNIGKNLVEGLWNGISDMTGWILDKIKGFGNSVLDGIKSFFGIHSPSKVFENEVGKMLTLGMAKGIENNLNPVKNAMDELNNSTFGMIDADFTVSTKGMQSDSSQLISVINGLRKDILARPTTTNIIDGITYDDGSNVSNAMKEIVRAVKVERRV